MKDLNSNAMHCIHIYRILTGASVDSKSLHISSCEILPDFSVLIRNVQFLSITDAIANHSLDNELNW